MKKLLDFLFIPPEDISLLVSAKVRRQKILSFMLRTLVATVLGLMSIILAVYVISPGNIHDKELIAICTSGLISLVGFALVAYINQHISSRAASLILLAVAYVGIINADTLHEIVYGRSLIFLTVPVIMAAILFPPWGGIVVAVINSTAISYIAIFYKSGLPNFPAIWVLFFIAFIIWQSTSVIARTLAQIQISNRSLLEAKEEARLANIGLEQRVAERTAELLTTNEQLRAEITERQQVEASLRESEDKFKYLFDNSIIGKSFTMLSGEVNTNKAFCDMLGYTSAELQNKKWQDITHPDDIELTQKEIDLLLSGEQDSVRFFKRFIHKDGSEVLVDLSSFIRLDNNGRPPYLITTLIDITEQRLAEEALQKSKEKYQLLIENMNAGVFQTNLSGKFLQMNSAVVKMAGYDSIDELMSKPASCLYANPADRELFKEILVNHGEVRNMELQSAKKDGTHYWISINAVLQNNKDGEPESIIGIVNDINEHKHLENEVKENQANLEALIENTDDSIWSVDRNYQLIVGNSIFHENVHGANGAKLAKGSSVLNNTFTPEMLKEWQGYYDKVLRGGKASVEIQRTRFTSEIRYMDYRFRPIVTPEGEITGVTVFGRDITERKHAEEALRESERRFETIFRSSPIGIAISRLDDGIFLDANEAFFKMFGYDRYEVVNHNVAILPDREEAHRLFQELHLRGSVQQFEAKFQHKSGKIGAQQVSMELIELNGQKCVLGSTFNITKRKKLENDLKEVNQQLEARVEQRTAELRESQIRMNKLARQVVTVQEEERKRISDELHDEAGHLLIGLRSPLDILYKDLLSTKDEHHKIAAKALKLTDEVAERIRSLSYSLHPPMLEVLGLKMSIKSLCRDFSENTGIQVTCDLNGTDLTGIPNEIDISLYRFVREALTNIHKHAHATKADVFLTHDNAAITITVQDNGLGMKPRSRDAYGLGLKTIIERLDILGGELKIEGVAGRGTKIQAFLPLKNSADQTSIRSD